MSAHLRALILALAALAGTGCSSPPPVRVEPRTEAQLRQELETLFVMAELAYLAGKRTKDPGCYLAAAVYAYLYLLPADVTRTPSAYSRHFRWACDIYNRSLAKAFEDPKSGQLALTAGRRAVPMGSVEVMVDFSAFPFSTTAAASSPRAGTGGSSPS